MKLLQGRVDSEELMNPMLCAIRQALNRDSSMISLFHLERLLSSSLRPPIFEGKAPLDPLKPEFFV